MIEIADVHKAFGDLKVLNGINLKVEKGEVLSVIGPSGSGKSTLLQCINGLEPIQEGGIIVDGVNVHDTKTNINKLRTCIGMVFQHFNIFPHLTVLENVALAPRIVQKHSRLEAEKRGLRQLDRVGLIEKAHKYPSSLSGGQQQRLGIARALSMEPEYMLFDEVTSALDPELVHEVLDTLRMLSSDGMTMILVTHEIAFAREVSHRVAFFDKGVVVELGSPEQVIAAPREERTQQFLSKMI